MTATWLIVKLLLTTISLNLEIAHSQSLATQNLDSLSTQLNIEISKLTSPALEERKRIRREMQRAGYSNVLMDVINGDGFSSLISYIKTKLHIEYSISHQPLFLRIPIQGGEGKTYDILLHDNWTFPADPWKKEQ